MSPLTPSTPLTNSSWGSGLTFSVPGYTPPNVQPSTAATGWGSDLQFNVPGYTPAVQPMAQFDFLKPAPPPVSMPIGPVNNWTAFFQGLLGTGVQYLLQKDAVKRAAELQKQGVAAEVVQHPDGTYFVQEKPNFFTTVPGVITIVAVGGLLLYLIARKK